MLTETIPSPTSAANSWKAHLELAFAARENRTALTLRRHTGPLVVQKPLYPEGANICHTVILHPPAGIAGGDELTMDIEAGPGSHAVISTPSATKWYKSGGRTARQNVNLRVGSSACLEWLPQENIFFESADARLSLTLELADGARAIGWDAVMLGRAAAGETWASGKVLAENTFFQDGKRIWLERGLIAANDPVRHTRTGLDGMNIAATLWAVSPACTLALTEELGDILPWSETIRAGATCLPGNLLLVRIIGRDIEPVRNLLVSLWMRLRQPLTGVAAQPLRLWAS